MSAPVTVAVPTTTTSTVTDDGDRVGNNSNNNSNNKNHGKNNSKSSLPPGDMDVIVKLSSNYNRIMELKQLETLAMFRSTKQTAWASIAYLSVLFILGTAFVKAKTDAPISQAILFSVYTFTSAGFGNVDIPNSSSFLAFVIFYVFAAISALAILVAQTFQYLELQASRWKHTRDRATLAAAGQEKLNELERTNTYNHQYNSSSSIGASEMDQKIRKGLRNALALVPHTTKLSSSHTSSNTALSVFFSDPRQIIVSKYQNMGPVPKAFLFLVSVLLIGAITMMYLEDWSFVTALYFATFAMTTVGYGDAYPTTEASTWFVNFWLPCNVAFLAVYLGTVAHCYVAFSNWNATRIEEKLKQQNNHTEEEHPNDSSLDADPTNHTNNNNNNNNMDADAEAHHQTPILNFFAEMLHRQMKQPPKQQQQQQQQEEPEFEDGSMQTPNRSTKMDVSFEEGSFVYHDKQVQGHAQNQDQNLSVSGHHSNNNTIHSTGGNDDSLTADSQLPKKDASSMNHESTAAEDIESGGITKKAIDQHQKDNLTKSPLARSSSKLAGQQQIPELLTVLEGEKSPNPKSQQHPDGGGRRQRVRQFSHGHDRRERIRQFSHWSAEKSDFFGGHHQESFSDGEEDDAKIETTMDLLMQLALTKATGAALLESKKGTTDTQDDPSLLNIKVHFKVLERLARIIAAEAKSIDAEVEINGNILAVTMERLKDTAEYWLVPTRAREAFRSVTFASLIFVGEREIFYHGVDAFFNLNPLQFHSIFGPFVVAMEDIDTMIAWLVSTQSLRDQLEETPLLGSNAGLESSTRHVDHILSARRQNRRNLKNKIEMYFPPNPGNAVRIQM